MSSRVCITCLVFTLLLTGCWDRTEVNDLAIIKAVAVDKTESGLLLTMRVFSPKKGKTGGSENGMMTELFAAEGSSIAVAARNLQRKLSRRLFWAHAGPLIIGEELAREGVLSVIDFWSRFSEPRLSTYVIIAPGEAQDLIKATPTLERILSEALREIINMNHAVPTRMRDFLGALRTAGDNPVAPRFERVPAVTGAPETEVRATGTAVFRQDRLVGWMDPEETTGLLFLRDNLQSALIPVRLPGDRTATVRIIRSNTVTRAYSERGRLHISILVRPEGDVLDSSADLDLGKPEVVALFQSQLATTIRRAMHKAAGKAQQELGADVLRFGDAFRRDLPLRWDDGLKDRWEREFPKVQVEVAVRARIRRTGAHGAPLGQPPEKVKKATGNLLRQMR